MKRLLLCAGITLWSLLAAVLFISCTKDKTTTVEFKGNYTTTREELEPPPLQKQRGTGTGSSTGVNVTRFETVSIANFGTPPPFALSGSATFYAEGGDVFYTSFEGTLTPGAGGMMTLEVTHHISGGTGKFKQAAGVFTGKALASATIPTNTITFDGSITY